MGLLFSEQASRLFLWTTLVIKQTKMVWLKKPMVNSVSDLWSDPTGRKPTAGAKSKWVSRRHTGSGRSKEWEKKTFNTIFFVVRPAVQSWFLGRWQTVSLPEWHLEALKPGWLLGCCWRKCTDLLGSLSCGIVNYIHISRTHLFILSKLVTCPGLYFKWLLITKWSASLAPPLISGKHRCCGVLYMRD